VLGGFVSTILGKIAPRGVKVSTLNNIVSGFLWLVCISIAILSVSRIASVGVNYNAPVHLYTHLYETELKSPSVPISGNVNICVGKEWYRFTSNFFLPSSRFVLAYVESSFTGQLPNRYGLGSNATWIIPPNMNDENREERSRYINVSACHYMVDLEFDTQTEPHYSKISNWEVILQLPFLDAATSPTIFRAFYVPFLSSKYCNFSTYYLLRNKAPQ